MSSSIKSFSGLAIALVALAGVASPAFADSSIYLEVGPQYGGTNPYQYGDGGEFTALAPSLGVPAGYSSLATLSVNGVTGFETFCVEDQVDFSVGTTYYYTEGSTLQQTGAGVKDQLTVGVAWLYEQFATGALSSEGYNYTNAATRLIDAGELQSTLWYLQGEPADSNVFPNQPDDPFTTLVINEFGSLAAAQAAATPDEFGVQVLELTSSPGDAGTVAQDQLIYTTPVSVADGGTTIGLLAISLLPLVFFRRRQRRRLALSV
jgi:hypothetical protein